MIELPYEHPHMSSSMHLYERLQLFPTGLALGVVLIVAHAFLLLKTDTCQIFLRKFPRNQKLGQVLLGIGMLWFWLLIAPEGNGFISFLAMDMTEFNAAKPILRFLMPILFVLVAMSITEFLSVRAFGMLGLLVAQPLLEAAFLREPSSRLLIPIWAYALVTASLFCVGMPYLFRDAVTWVSARSARWKAFCGAGMLYGVVIVVCALSFWRGQ
jgi:hypothetical protein